MQLPGSRPSPLFEDYDNSYKNRCLLLKYCYNLYSNFLVYSRFHKEYLLTFERTELLSGVGLLSLANNIVHSLLFRYMEPVLYIYRARPFALINIVICFLGRKSCNLCLGILKCGRDKLYYSPLLNKAYVKLVLIA